MSTTLFRRSLLSVMVCVLILALVPAPASAQIQIKNDDVTIKFGFGGQFWTDWLQDATAATAGNQGYTQNFGIRRARFIMGGNIGSNISFFFETDDPKLGFNPKNLSSGFVIQDAFISYKANNYFELSGGEMLLPSSRHNLQSPFSLYSLDYSAVGSISNAPLQESAFRDMGLQARGYFFKDHLQYRGGVFAGERDANGRNALHPTLYLEYDAFAPQKEYAYTGTALGKKKTLAFDIGGDKQGTYRSENANITSNTPVNGGDEVGFNLNFFHYDGRTKFTAIPDQNNFFGEFAYYIHQAKFQPYFRWETQRFVLAVNNTKDINRVGFGANYYVRGQNLKFTFQWLRAQPQNGSTIRPSNELTIQMQAFYF